ncbi:UNKNOWN [Stylonychia lemnae]|uniref:Uncharacterized protein n=1 Tax=Stylonychia lemnae TaxID=5949 RepID=A0A078B1I1_STYLE|nr:UNKNOWN [Stylonychia lemnae]|eukprot:CDW87103.1 UNKNOWN [Stylonychia lemnae]
MKRFITLVLALFIGSSQQSFISKELENQLTLQGRLNHLSQEIDDLSAVINMLRLEEEGSINHHHQQIEPKVENAWDIISGIGSAIQSNPVVDLGEQYGQMYLAKKLNELSQGILVQNPRITADQAINLANIREQMRMEKIQAKKNKKNSFNTYSSHNLPQIMKPDYSIYGY